eukprot:scaffold996_cov190-Alexandrium_tamarense.AAC.20
MVAYAGLVAVLSLVPSLSFQLTTTSRFRHPTLSSAQRISNLQPNNDLQHHHKVYSSLNLVSPSAALSAVGSPLGSIAVLAFVILVHEAGHFIAARSLGINVDEFSVGVGPRLLGVRKVDNGDNTVFEWIKETDEINESSQPKEGIEFSLRAFPLGGYVKFPENYDREQAFEQEDVARRARNVAREMRVENASGLEKALESIAAKSFILNAMSLGLLKKWVEGRENEQLKQAEDEVLLESKNISATKKSKGGSWLSTLPWVSKYDNSQVDAEGSAQSTLQLLQAAKQPDVEYYTDPNLLQNRPWNERAIVLSGGVVFNIILAFVCYFGELTLGRGLPHPIFDAGAVVSSIPSKESPSFGVLKQGDVIVGVNDVIISTVNAKQTIYASQTEISDVISTIRKTPDGESVRLTIFHGKESDKKEVVVVTPKRNDDGLASIGVMLGPNYLKTELIKASSLFDAVSKSAAAVYDITSQTASSIFGLLIGLLFGKGLPAGTSMSGPIGVVKSGADVVKTSDLPAIVAFAASISVNLAVVNSLPLPALDGGQLLFVLAEAAAGRKIDQRVQEAINATALTLLLFISVGTAVGDVTSIFK